ncbi:MAG: 2-methylcitrate dehydratase PrpD [Clostridium sp.]|jgi:2-methylcitrate dehydratase PrpD
MKFNTNYILENYILNTKWEDLSKQVQERAIVCSIDLMTALILGSKGNQYKAGVKLAKSIYQDGNVQVIGSDEKFNFIGATVVLGHAANSFDIDDGHNMIKGHPGAAIIAGILAAALEKDITYKEFLTTVVVSYETAIRSGLAMQSHYNYLHSTGSYGAVGTSAGVSRIFGFSKEQLNNALSIADFHAPLTPVMRSVEYPSMNKDGVPFGALIGAMSVLETLSGSSGKTHLLELEEFDFLLKTLGKEYEIMNLYFKPFTCCRWAHPAILASLSLIKKNNINKNYINKVNVYTFDSATKLSKIIPKTTDEAQYNISFPIAVGIADGDVGIEQVIDKNLNRKDVISFMKKINFIVDEEIEAKFPAERLCKVEFILENGTSYMSDTFAPIGEAKDNIDMNWIKEKFERITKPLVTKENQNRIIYLLSDINNISMRKVVDYINNCLD